jgi:hypothetical protein
MVTHGFAFPANNRRPRSLFKEKATGMPKIEHAQHAGIIIDIDSACVR